MPNFRDLVGPLAAFQRRLSLEFDTMMHYHSIRTVNYYEMNSELEGDDKVRLALSSEASCSFQMADRLL